MAESKRPSWGHLEKRFGEKTQETPRKMLALDGGGFRGVLTLQVLIRIEELLRERSGQGDDFRLCNFFDYIGGTSTGAIIAAGLAIGMSAKELSDFYIATGPKMFEKAFILERLRHLYKKEPLTEELKKTYGAKTDLGSSKLKSLLLVVTRNVSTDSPWPISSNPFARFNHPARKDCNLQIPLWQLVRASTAAPVFFPPEVLQWDPKDASSTFLFEDGGLTPYNNPSFLIARMATQEEYGLGWKTGENHLLIVSIGTGASPKSHTEMSGRNAVENLVSFPGALMYGAQIDQDINCRTVGRCVYGAHIDRELGDLIPRRGEGEERRPIPLSEDLGRAFLYARYNAELSQDWLNARGLGKINPAHVSKLDGVEYAADLVRVGKALAKDVKLEHFALERFGQFY